MWAIFIVIAGIVLKANPTWFNGAATVGTFCFWVGIIILVIWAIFVIIALLSASSRRF